MADNSTVTPPSPDSTTPGSDVSMSAPANKSMWQQIAAWGLANAMNNNQELTNAEVAKMTGSPVSQIPFGNITITNPNPPAPAAQPSSSSGVLGTLAHGAMGAGILGAGLLAAKALFPPAAALPLPIPPPPAVEQAAEDIPLVIDYSLEATTQQNTEVQNGGQPPGL